MSTSLTNLSHAILSTLQYSALYNFPLTAEEIHQRLPLLKSKRSEIVKELASLISAGHIICTDKFYTLKGASSFFKLRANRENFTRQKLEQNFNKIRIISYIPWVEAIYLTGSLAVANAKSEDDIDLMIITKPKKLWLVRLIATLLTEIMGARRRPKKTRGKDINNKLCLNLYLTSSSLEIPPHKRSLYTAYELIQARMLIGTQAINNALLMNNSWLTHFLPNYELPKVHIPRVVKSFSILDFLDYLAYLIQRIYMSKRISTEYVTYDRAFFHPTATPSRNHLHTIDSIVSVASQAKKPKQTIVLATGFFDLLHEEHLNFLRKAKEKGDILIVAVESDERARALKGKGRPVESQLIRAQKLIATGIVDYVVLLDKNFNNQESYAQLLQNTHVDIYAISSHTSHQDNKKKLVEKYGGQLLIVHDWNKKVSTTQIINSEA